MKKSGVEFDSTKSERGKTMSNSEVTQPPLAPAKLVGHQWVVGRCPYCGRKHYHGAGRNGEDPRKLLGHRVAHCDQDLTLVGYILVEAGAAKKSRKAGGREAI